MTVDRPDPWYAELPELDGRGRRIVLDVLRDVLVYRDVTRADVRDAYDTAAAAPGAQMFTAADSQLLGCTDGDGTVYLLHFDRPIGHMQHYTGWTADLPRRMHDHASGTMLSSQLARVAKAHGIGFVLAATFAPATCGAERALKHVSKKLICPLCGGDPTMLPGGVSLPHVTPIARTPRSG